MHQSSAVPPILDGSQMIFLLGQDINLRQTLMYPKLRVNKFRLHLQFINLT
jgi:hypothetical protein